MITRIEDLADPTFNPYLSDEVVFGDLDDPYPRLAELRCAGAGGRGRLPGDDGHPDHAQ